MSRPRNLHWTAAMALLLTLCVFRMHGLMVVQADSAHINAPGATTPQVQGKSKTSGPSQKSASLAQSNDNAPTVPGLTDFPPEKTVIRNGGEREVRLQLSPTFTPEQAAQQRLQVRDLLAISSRNLKRIAQLQLDANQQDMLEQVHNYMAQARSADQTGEPHRALILASKARQLSDDLAGVRTILKLWPW